MLPSIHDSRGAVTNGDELSDLKKEIERLRLENRLQADLLAKVAPPAQNWEARPPSSGSRNGNRTTPGQRNGSYTNTPKLQAPQSPSKVIAQSPKEHPLKAEYRDIQASALRWVTADQPFQKAFGPGLAICEDVSEDFYRSLVNQATFNLPKELRYSLSMAQESLAKLEESLDVLLQSQRTVDKSTADTLVDIQQDFELSRDRLRNKELYFTNEVNQYKEEMAHKVDTELAIVRLLIKTLDSTVTQANEVLLRNLRPDDKHYGGGRTLNDIRAEYNKFRRVLMPSWSSAVSEQLTGRAAELLSLEKGSTIHDIINALLATLAEALAKARHTEERLLQHRADIVAMCDRTVGEFGSDFGAFRETLSNKEESTLEELHRYRTDTSQRILSNVEIVQTYQRLLTDHVGFGSQMLNKGNDYQMFKQNKEMKNQMVLMYAELAKLRLQYDGIMFHLASTELDVPIAYIGTLVNAVTKRAVDWSPTANKSRAKNKFMDSDMFTDNEVEHMKRLFVEFDKDNSGAIDSNELKTIWHRVWPWASDDEISSVANRLIARVDIDGSGTVDYHEFLKILELEYGSQQAEGGAFHT